MFEEVFGLPAHPLLVHAAVVVVPVLTLAAVAYALLPSVRDRLEPLVLGLAVTGPLAVAVARESGEAFRRRLTSKRALPPELTDQLDTHAQLSRTLLLFTLALAAATIAFVLLARSSSHTARPRVPPPTPSTRSMASPARPGVNFRRAHTATARFLAITITALGCATAWYVAHTGHSGASMVWNGL